MSKYTHFWGDQTDLKYADGGTKFDFFLFFSGLTSLHVRRKSQGPKVPKNHPHQPKYASPKT